MTSLPQTFRKSGWDYRLIERRGDVVIFEQSKGGEDVRYEVAIVQRHNGYEIGGKVIPPGEVMPSPEQWGVKGWTYMEMGRAFEKVGRLVEEMEFK